MGGCQNYGPFLGTLNIRCRIILGYPKRDHNFDNHPYEHVRTARWILLGVCVLRFLRSRPYREGVNNRLASQMRIFSFAAGNTRS